MNNKLCWVIPGLLVVALFHLTPSADGQVNVYTNTVSGKWETGANWSQTVPPTNTHSVFITNQPPKTVTIDATTTNFPTTLTVNNLTVQTATNTLLLSNSGTNQPLIITGPFSLGTGAAISNVNAGIRVGTTCDLDGPFTLMSGSLSVTNGPITLGSATAGNGRLTVNGGTTFFNAVTLGSGTNAQGTWLINGGTNTLNGTLFVGQTSTGTVVATGGQLVVTTPNQSLRLGGNASGRGDMTISNADVRTRLVEVGFFGTGTLTVNGGPLNVLSNTTLGVNGGSTGTVTMTSGSMLVQTGSVTIGNAGLGRMTVSNASFQVNLGTLTVGSTSTGNTLVIIGGGTFLDTLGVVSSSVAAPSNTIVVDGIGSVWSNTGAVTLGNLGARNRLTITNSGQVFNDTCIVGSGGNSSNNVAVVTGAGSRWSNAGTLTVGNGSSGNQLLVLNGAAVENGQGVIGAGSASSSNLVVVAGLGSVWRNAREVELGRAGPTNALTITGGASVLASNMVVGGQAGSVSNSVTLDGTLIVTNSLASAALSVQRGTFTFTNGLLTVDNLMATNGATSAFDFGGGTIDTKRTIISNTQPFVVGDGVNGATFHMNGGTHTFLANGLRISTNAALTGCGTIQGSVVNNGTVSNDCGLLTFTGVVTNNATITVAVGATIDFNALVVNLGTIDARNGTAHFNGGLTGSGPVFTTGINSYASSTNGKWEVAGNWSLTLPPRNDQSVFITNVSAKTVTIDAVTTNTLSAMVVSNLTLRGFSGATNTLAVSNVTVSVPFQVLDQLTIGTNAAVTILNSTVQVNGRPYSLVVDGQMTVNSGSLIDTNVLGANANILIGKTGNGRLTINGGTVLGYGLSIADGPSPGAQGTVTLAAGGLTIVSNTAGIFIGTSTSATGTFYVTAGILTNDAGFTIAANNPNTYGQMIVSNGSVFSSYAGMGLGGGPNSFGALTVAGGAIDLPGLTVGQGNGATGSVLVTGGQLVITNQLHSFSDRILLGKSGTGVFGQMTVSNGTVRVGAITVGGDSVLNSGGGNGNLVVAGGTVTVSSDVSLGYTASTTGTVTMTGGQLALTNAAGTATFSVGVAGVGTVTLNAGAMTIDKLLVTNGANSVITINGGTLTNRAAFVTNGVSFVVGDTGGNATYVALGGTHGFNNDLIIGNSSAGNRLIVTNGAAVLGGNIGKLGVNAPSSNNVAVVTGSGSVWSNQTDTWVGYSGASNNLFIVNGGGVYDNNGILGYFGARNAALVAGAGSVWSHRVDLIVGNAGALNTLTITNGSAVLNRHAFIGGDTASSNNTVLVAGAGSVWSNRGDLYVGYVGPSNSLSIANGAVVVASNAYVGLSATAIDSTLIATFATLSVTAPLGDGVLDVRRGTLTFNSATITVDNLVLTNGAGRLAFNSGTLTSKGTAVANTQPFFVGNGTNPATFLLSGGTHAFADGLRVSTNAALTGCGTISGVVVNFGLITNSCAAGNLIFNSAVTNNMTMAVASGGQLVFNAPFVNNGVVNARNGFLQINSSIVNNGVLDALNTWISNAGGQWEDAGNWLSGAPSISQLGIVIGNANTKTVTINGTTTNTPSTMTVSNLTVMGPSGTVNTLGLINAGTNIPLHIIDNATITTGGALVLSNAALRVDGQHSEGLIVDGTGSLTLTDGVLSVTNLFVGLTAGSGATLTMAGGTLSVDGFVVIGHDAASTGTVLVGGGQMIVTNGPAGLDPDNGFVVLGKSGAGQLVFSNGLIRTRTMQLGREPQGRGFLFVNGPGALLTNSESLLMGPGGNGSRLIVLNGGRIDSPVVTIGQSNSFGNFSHVTGPNSLWNIGTLTVGVDGSDNTLVISNNATVHVTGTFTAGAGSGTNNTIRTVDGGNLIVGIPIVLGTTNGADATLQVAGGTTSLGADLIAGNAAQSTGSVSVTDGGQLVATNGVIGIGNSGTLTNGTGVGQMNVSSGTVLAVRINLGSSEGGRGDMTIQTGGTVSFDCSTNPDCSLTVNDLVLDGGLLQLTNGTLYCGHYHAGTMIMSNGDAQCQEMYVGYDYPGTMAMFAGNMSVLSLLHIGESGGATGAVWMSNGQFVMTNLSTHVGSSGVGQLTLSNGTLQASQMFISNSPNPGTLTVVGGVLNLSSNLNIGTASQATGTTWVIGGQLLATNSTITIGSLSGVGQLILSNGFVQARSIVVAGNSGAQRTLTMTGGNLTLNNLFLTNAAGRLSFKRGQVSAATLTASNGQPVVVGDGTGTATLSLSDSTGSFFNGLQVQTGGAVAGCGQITGTVVVAAGGVLQSECEDGLTIIGSVTNNGTLRPKNGTTLVVTGSVINNGILDLSSGTTNFSASFVNNGTILNATDDNDGDGMNNLQEQQTGTDPLDASSLFRVTSAVVQGSDVKVTWKCGAGCTNVVQSCSSLTNNWVDVSSQIIVTGSGVVTTNYLYSGGATSVTNRFYRIRLQP